MTDKYIIREYQSFDYNEITKLWEATNLSNPQRADDNAVIERTLQMGGTLLVLVSSLEDRIVGTSWLTTDGRRIYLHHFGILPEYQRQGLGWFLLLESLKFAKSRNMQVKLEVHQNNLPAIALYKKAGFNYLGDYKVYIIRDFVGVHSI